MMLKIKSFLFILFLYKIGNLNIIKKFLLYIFVKVKYLKIII
jgi:hypothetical protein